MKPSMNKLILPLLAISLLFACKDDEMDTVTLEEAQGSLQTEDSLILGTTPEGTAYAYSEFEFTLSKTNEVGASVRNSVYYKFEYDSVGCYINNQYVPVEYEFSYDDYKQKIVHIKPETYFPHSGTLKLSIYGSWYYSPSSDPYLTEKPWELLEVISQDVEYNVIASPLPQKALVDFEKTEKKVSPYYVPKVQFNFKPGKEIALNASAKTLYFKYDLDYSLKTNDKETNLHAEFDGDTNAYLNYDGKLPLQQDCALSVSATWYKRYSKSDEWEQCDGAFDEAIAQTLNVTDEFEPSLTDDDISFSYPLNRQFNFLKGEYGKGYIQLKDPEAQKWLENHLPLVTIENVKTGISVQETSSYNSNYGIVEYAMSSGFFNNDQVYKITFTDTESAVALYTYYFKTSGYDTFSEKWEDNIKDAFEGKWRDIEFNYLGEGLNLHLQKINVTCNNETLDYYECNMDDALLPLIQLKTQVPDDWEGAADWEIYSWSTLEFDRANMPEKKYGFPPLNANYFLAQPTKWAIKLSDNSLAGEIEYPELPLLGIMVWEVQDLMYYDAFTATRNAQEIPSNQRDARQDAAAKGYPNMPRIWYDFALGGDTYPLMDILYVLPGIDLVTTSIEDIQL